MPLNLIQSPNGHPALLLPQRSGGVWCWVFEWLDDEGRTIGRTPCEWAHW